MKVKTVIINSAFVLVACCSAWAYLFLQKQKQQLVITGNNTVINKTENNDTIIIINNKKENNELSPELELLNFVLRKGREGIPVLLLNYWF